jgi:hypothetical protein
MDSVLSWFMAVILANVGLVLLYREYLIEKKQYEEENDRFFKNHDKK